MTNTMRMTSKGAKVLLLVLTVFILIVGGLALFYTGFLSPWAWQPRRTIRQVERGADLRDANVSRLDLRAQGGMIRTFGFNQRTLWPPPARLPDGFVPGAVLTNAMNPGLGVRQLHREGITGKGVAVAIIDYPVLNCHPEFSDQVAEVHAVQDARGPSMHGPAVASLLVGRQCGVAPGARLYFVATPDPGRDAKAEADALDWIIEKNKSLPTDERIRVVSVSANPSGPGSPYRNGKAWDEAVERAEKSGLMVIDAVPGHGFLGPCNLDPNAPDDVSRCTPIPSQRGPALFAGRLFVPVAPRTIAEEWSPRRLGYRYCGWMDHTHGFFGTSWSMPYCSGVLALGWQVNPNVSAARMKELLFESACQLPGGEKIINPPAFIAAVKREPQKAERVAK